MHLWNMLVCTKPFFHTSTVCRLLIKQYYLILSALDFLLFLVVSEELTPIILFLRYIVAK